MKTSNSSSAKIEELIKKANVFALPKHKNLPESNIKILDSANESKRLLRLQELNILCKDSHCNAKKLEELQQRLPSLINEAKATAAVLGYNFPDSEWYESTYDLINDFLQ